MVADAPPHAAVPHAAVPPRRENALRRLYRWVLSWAETPYGTPALAAVSFAESSFFPIPPDVLQIALSASRPNLSFYYAGVSAVASVLGGVAGWAIGYLAWEACRPVFFACVPGMTPEHIEHVGQLYQQNAFWSIFAAAFTPIPYKVFTIAAGVFHDYVSLGTLVAASLLGRSGRFFLVATVVWWMGPTVRGFLEKWLEAVTLALFALLVGGFFVARWLAG